MFLQLPLSRSVRDGCSCPAWDRGPGEVRRWRSWGREEAPGVFMNVTLGRSVERSIGVGPGCELSSAGEQGEQGAGRSNPEWEWPRSPLEGQDEVTEWKGQGLSWGRKCSLSTLFTITSLRNLHGLWEEAPQAHKCRTSELAGAPTAQDCLEQPQHLPPLGAHRRRWVSGPTQQPSWSLSFARSPGGSQA